MITIDVLCVWQWQQHHHHHHHHHHYVTASNIFTYRKMVIFIPVERVARGVCSTGYCREML